MNSLYGNFRNKKFTDIYGDVDTFKNDYNNVGIPAIISDENITTLYYLLYAKFGNSTIASSDENRFKYSLFSTIWKYGPSWEKKLDIQAKLRELSDEDLIEGSKQIYNKAQNPSTNPDIMTDEELQYINDQTVAKSKRGKLDAYAVLIQLLENDVTEEFLRKFNNLFISFVMPEYPLWYVTDEEEN